VPQLAGANAGQRIAARCRGCRIRDHYRGGARKEVRREDAHTPKIELAALHMPLNTLDFISRSAVAASAKAMAVANRIEHQTSRPPLATAARIGHQR